MDPASLERVAPLLTCPTCAQANLSPRAGGLRCACGARVPNAGGWLDFLGDRHRPAPSERIFQSPLVSRAYAWLRERPPAALVNGMRFDEEVDLLAGWLSLRADTTLLDVPCGQGNFTSALARRCARGVVVAVDLSAAQLALAVARLAREGVRNVVPIRASALDLPVRDRSVDAVVTPGGFHLYPDVPRAIDEMHRVLLPGGPVAGLTFRARTGPLGLAQAAAERLSLARAFDFERLGDLFTSHGFAAYRWEGRRLIGWFGARTLREAA